MWKKWAIWFKGALAGLLTSLVLSILFYSNNMNPGGITCKILTNCAGLICEGCLFVGIMFNLFYGFVIGALIGLLINKRSSSEDLKNLSAKKIAKRKGRK